MIDEEVTLITDVYSNFSINEKDRKPYAKRGEKVKIISESLPALIVETKKGLRFPVNVEKVIFKIKTDINEQ